MTVPQNLQTTIRRVRFLAVNEHLGDENSEKIIICCNSEQQYVLNSAKYWVADVTFDVVRKTLFYQLLIITAVSATQPLRLDRRRRLAQDWNHSISVFK